MVIKKVLTNYSFHSIVTNLNTFNRLYIMKSICIFTSLVSVCIVLSICTMIIMRYNNRANFIKTGELSFGEDLYQRESAMKNMKQRSFINAIFTFDIPNEIRRKSVIDSMVVNTDKFTKNYFKKYNNIYTQIKNKKLYIENTKESIYDNIDQYNIFPLLLIYSYDTSQILVMMDHVYIGGYFFQEWSTFVFKGEPIKPYRLQYMPVITELICLRFLLCKALPSYFDNHQHLSLVDNRDLIKRFGLKINIGDIKNKYKDIKPKVYIIYTLAQLLLKYISIDRNVNILLPVAFENDRYAYNNVGAIFIDIGKRDTLKSIMKKLSNNAYNATATNALMQIVNQGKRARQKIDIIMTIGYIKNPTLTHLNEIKRVEVSYSDIAHYGIYCASFTYDTVAHVSITVNTKEFAYDSLLKNEPNIFPIHY